jgi:branched-chain amino acid transport system substrate-binding protein
VTEIVPPSPSAAVSRRSALRALGGLAAGGLGLGALNACAATPGVSPPTGTIPIGLLIPQTDDLKPVGSDIYDGFQLYTELNKPFGTYDIDIVQTEERPRAADNKAIVEGLIKQGVSAIAGVAQPETMLAIRDTVEEGHIPLIGAHNSPAALQSVLWIWSASYVGNEPGEAVGRYLHSIGRSVALVDAGDLAGTDAVAGFQHGYAATINSNRIFRLGADRSHTAVANDIRSLDPDAIFCALTGDVAARFLKALHAAGVKAEIYAPGDLTEGSALDALIAATGEGLVAGIYTAMNYASDLTNSTNQLFASRFRSASQGRPPSAYAVAGWDAAQALDMAIRACGDAAVTRDLINAKLGGLGLLTSPRGTIAFNQTRTPLQKWYLRQVMRDGPKLANVTVRSLATLG